MIETNKPILNTKDMSKPEKIGLSSIASSISCCCCIMILISISYTWYLRYMEIKSIGKGDYKAALAYGVVDYMK